MAVSLNHSLLLPPATAAKTKRSNQTEHLLKHTSFLRTDKMVKGVLTVGTLLRILSLIWIIRNCVGWQRLCEERETLCTVGLCATPPCDECNNKRSICHPTDPSETIPQTLPNNTLHILIYYRGPSVDHDMNMFKMFYCW